MAHSLSAQKRVRQNIKSRARNRWNKGKFRTAVKEYRETILHGTVDQAQTQLQGLYKIIDQIASKGSIHKKTASRYKSRLATKVVGKQQAA